MKAILLPILLLFCGNNAFAETANPLSIYFLNKLIEIENKYYLLDFKANADNSISIEYALNQEMRVDGKFATITFVKGASKVRNGYSEVALFAKEVSEIEKCGYTVLTAYMNESVTTYIFTQQDESEYINVFGDSLSYHNELMKSLCKDKI